jgi:CelD/BcsL family acetyltransferase involved in cellulose biosynthesis
MSISIDMVTSGAELHALTDEWNVLADRDPESSPYQSATITLGLWGIFARQVRPHVITARDRGGRLVGVLPTGIHRRRLGPIRMRVLGPLSLWYGSYFDAVVAVEHPEALREIMSATRRREVPADTVAFPHLRPGSHLARGARDTRDYLIGVESTRHEIALAATGGDAGRNTRAIRRTWRRLLDALPTARYEALTSAAAIEGWIQRFADLHRRRWNGTPTPSIFTDQAASQAFSSWFARLADQDLAELHVIRTDDALLAGLCVFRWRGCIYGWRQAADPALAKHGLGIQLNQQAMATAGARGDRLYDMGRGAESYKHTWSARETGLLRSRAPGPGIRWSLLDFAGQALGRPWTRRWLQGVDGVKPATATLPTASASP